MNPSAQSPPKCRPASGDWLPFARPRTIASKVLRNGVTQALKHEYWFLTFASAIQATDAIQSKMRTKFYLLMRDFIPDGLVGRYGHISGRDVMKFLMCHSETTASRHKVSKYAERTFTELEHWMAKANNWQEALRMAKAEADTEKKASKKRLAGKAPGLHSPAALLAVLVIPHPDTSKFRDWVGRLEIDWMMNQKRELVDVRAGFWKGINNSNLLTVFSDFNEELRSVELLADYDRLFGAEFPSCQKDLRPYLPAQWLERLTPPTAVISDAEDSSEAFEDSVDDESSPNSAGLPEAISDKTAEEVCRLRTHLNATGPEPAELEQWLVGELGSASVNKILVAWCLHWQERIDTVDNYQDQMTIRSLFMRSLHKLQNLAPAPKAWTNAFMLVDMADGQIEHIDKDLMKAMATLKKLPLYMACNTANNQLIELVEAESPSQRVRDCMMNMFAEQALIFRAFTQNSPFFTHWESVLAIEALYTQVIIQGHESPVMSPEAIQFWKDKRDIVLDEAVIAGLKLKYWQIRALCLPGSEANILTDWQNHVFRQKFTDLRVESFVDPSELRPMPVVNVTAYAQPMEVMYKGLHKLFGEVKQPRGDSSRTSRSRHASESHAPSPAVLSRPASEHPSMTPDLSSTQPLSLLRAPFSPPQRKSSQDLLPNNLTGSTVKKINRFAGKSYLPSKRPGSPLVDGPSKTRRLGGFVTRGDLAEELQEYKADLKADIQDLRHVSLSSHERTASEYKAVTGQLSNNIKLLPDSIFAQLNAHNKELHSAVQRDLKMTSDVNRKSLDDLSCRLQENGEVLTRLESQLKGETSVDVRLAAVQSSVQTVLQEQKEAVLDALRNVKMHKDDIATQLKQYKEDILAEVKKQVKLDVVAVVQDALKQQRDALFELVQVVHPPRPRTPLPGQDGFLSQCTAPAGWTQQAYESTLLRSAWFYFHALGNPDDGVGEDETALEMVTRMYPKLDEDHIILALDHAHMQAYGTLFNNKGQNGDEPTATA